LFEFKINQVDLLTPISANKFSAELFSSIDYRIKYSGNANVGFLRENNELVMIELLSTGVGLNETELNFTYIIENVGKRSLEFKVASGESTVSLFYLF
jgi:hypothetical protein